MPDQLDHDLARLPGETVVMQMRMAERDDMPVAVTAATITANFDAVKHLLSSKPMRRPNRTRPLDHP